MIWFPHKPGHRKKFHDQFGWVFQYCYHPILQLEILDVGDLFWVTKSDESPDLVPVKRMKLNLIRVIDL